MSKNGFWGPSKKLRASKRSFRKGVPRLVKGVVARLRDCADDGTRCAPVLGRVVGRQHADLLNALDTRGLQPRTALKPVRRVGVVDPRRVDAVEQEVVL